MCVFKCLRACVLASRGEERDRERQRQREKEEGERERRERERMREKGREREKKVLCVAGACWLLITNLWQ